MKTNQELLSERKERLRKAIALEKSDKTCCILMADAFCARHMGVKMSDFCKSIKASNQTMVESAKALGDFEGMNAAFAPSAVFPLIFMTHVKIPGVELPEDALWMLDEREMMTTADYDTILNKGWMPFMVDFLKNRIKFPLDETFAELAETPQLVKNFEDAGYLVYSPIVASSVPDSSAAGAPCPNSITICTKCQTRSRPF